MDLASKELLKMDLFIQGLSLMCQEKVLPSAATFADALCDECDDCACFIM